MKLFLAIAVALAACAAGAWASVPPETAEETMRDTSPVEKFLPRGEDGILKRFDGLGERELMSALRKYEPWSLTLYSGPSASTPMTQATQAGNAFAENFTAERDRVFLFGGRSKQKRYDLLLVRDPSIKDLSVKKVPRGSVHAVVIAHPLMAALEGPARVPSTQTVRPAMAVQTAGTILANLGRPVDPTITIRLKTGSKTTLGVRVDPDVRVAKARVFRQAKAPAPNGLGQVADLQDLPENLSEAEIVLKSMVGEQSGPADLVLVDPEVVKEAPKKWAELFRSCKIPGLQMSREAWSEAKDLTQADIAALIGALRQAGGLLRIHGVEVYQHSDKERYLFIFLSSMSD